MDLDGRYQLEDWKFSNFNQIISSNLKNLNIDLDEWWENVSENLEMFEEGNLFGHEEEPDEDWEPDIPEGAPTPDMFPEEPEPPEEDHTRWSGETIEELMENMRNFPRGMEEGQ